MTDKAIKRDILEEVIEKSSLGLLGVTVGVILGTIDCIICSGLPVLTAGLPTWVYLKILNSNSKAKNDGLRKFELNKEDYKGFVYYTIGASIPFAIKYHKEIYSAFENLAGK